MSEAYPQRIGDWDKVAINYGYRQFAPGTEETKLLAKILDDAWTEDVRFLTNQGMEVHPRADWWSNGVNQVEELGRIMKVRRAALGRVDRIMWLATGSPNAQVRAIASMKLSRLAARLKSEAGRSEPDRAQHTLLAADIQRFLDRPGETVKPIYAPDAPPGAPIGDEPMDWLARPLY